MRNFISILKGMRVNTFCWASLCIFLSLNLYLERSKSKISDNCLGEPIDVVYTWVNGSDPKFLIELSQSLPLKGKVDISKQRFDDKNELKFSLRSLEKHANWINHVYIVTNGQIPFWLNLDYEKVTVISHKQIFKDEKNLPTFSSPAIESNLHRIPGLSKKFIYLNDDIFLGLPIYPDDFYTLNKGYSVYLAWAIPGCASDCSWFHVADGNCDAVCNNKKCQFDGGDCSDNASRIDAENSTVKAINEHRSKSFKLHNNSLVRHENTLFRKMEYDKIIKNFPLDVTTDRYKSIPNIVEQYNNFILRQNRKKRNLKAKINHYLKQYYPQRQIDGFYESLQHTQRMLNRKYGFQVRKVAAHAPIMIDRDIMQKLQDTFKTEYEITERNRFRQSDDVQFAFSYYYFLMSETKTLTISNIFDEFDTDNSRTWSDREIRNLLSKIYELPLSYEIVDYFESILLNCTDINNYSDVVTPPYERYIDSKLPTITKNLVINCPFLKDYLEQKHSHVSLFKFNTIRHIEEYVSFKMLVSNITDVVLQLDEIRSKMTKFVCLNDNLVESKSDENELVTALLYDFYLSLFPNPSKYELPQDSRNRFLYLDELNEWKKHHHRTKIVLCLAIIILILVTFFNLFRKMFCKICSYLFVTRTICYNSK